MKKSIFVLSALALVLAGCDNSEKAAVQTDAQPVATEAPADTAPAAEAAVIENTPGASIETPAAEETPVLDTAKDAAASVNDTAEQAKDSAVKAMDDAQQAVESATSK
jgi:uncharacterized lipoprotein NlpE involved in copper resistance